MKPHEPGALRRQGGISLLEQIMLLAIASLLGCMALPPLHDMVIRQRIRSAQLDFTAGLRYARALAASENVRIVFCPTRDGRRCSNESQWDEGWLLGRDNNHDNQPDHEPLYVGRRRAGQVIVRSSEGRRHVLFHPNGNAPGSNITLLFCSRGSKDKALSIVIANSGRIRNAPASAAQTASCMADT